MCCFSVAAPAGFLKRLLAPRLHVSATKIFARMVAPGVQGLAYSMNLDTAREVAMVLPLPVRPGSGEEAVRFVDLKDDQLMFEELDALFDSVAPARAKGGLQLLSDRPTIKVFEVGSFIASYVPTVADFSRLDRRFRIPDVLFDAVPEYSDYGFAVFQLAPGKVTVHPMGFTFPTRELERIYFPTVHLHDGRWRPYARFDHALYYQHPRVRQGGSMFDGDPTSDQTPKRSYGKLADETRPVVRRTLRGKLPNEDVWIAVARPSTVGAVRAQ